MSRITFSQRGVCSAFPACALGNGMGKWACALRSPIGQCSGSLPAHPSPYIRPMGGRDAGPYWLAARLRKRLRCGQRKMFSPSLLSAHSILPAWRYRLRNSVQQKLYHLCCYYSRKPADVNSFFEISPVKNRWQMLAIPAARHIARWGGMRMGMVPSRQQWAASARLDDGAGPVSACDVALWGVFSAHMADSVLRTGASGAWMASSCGRYFIPWAFLSRIRHRFPMLFSASPAPAKGAS